MQSEPTQREETGIRRKLAALLAADVAGYTGLMAADEEGTTRRLIEFRGVTDSLIEHHGGRIANTAGDSILAEFPSSVDAVRCAIEIQEALRTKNDGLPLDRLLQFRIGINVGDVIEQGSDLLGDGINVAARLESIAEPGGICISEDVHNQIEGKLTLRTECLGKQRLRNLRRPVVAYRVTGSELPKDATTSRFNHLRLKGLQPFLVGGGVALVMLALGAIAWSQFRMTSVLPSQRGEAVATAPSRAAPATAPVALREILKRETFDGHFYTLIKTYGVTWTEAEAEARAMGGYLVSIGSEAENEFVTSMIEAEDSVWRKRDDGDRWQRFGPWIGLVQKGFSNEPAGGWVWSNGDKITYENWFWHQPDNYAGIEHFGRYREFSTEPGLKWDDARATATANGYIVEFEQ